MNLGIRCVVLILVAALHVHTAYAQAASNIDLDHTLSPEHACRSLQRPVQFFSETALLLLSGPAGNCYRSVDQLALNVISMDGRLLARKPWHSSDPGLVFAPGKLLLATPEGLEVDDQSLTSIQSLPLAPHRAVTSMLVRQQGTVSVLAYDRPSNGFHELLYAGTPLRLVSESETAQTIPNSPVFDLADGWTIVRSGESLLCDDKDRGRRVVVRLNWVIPPCEDYVNCQAYDAGAEIQVSTGKFSRILVFSNGSKFPITDAAGLFPYFRLEVFDVETGQSLFREENILRSGERYASLSPDGDRLATTDGRKVIIRDFK